MSDILKGVIQAFNPFLGALEETASELKNDGEINNPVFQKAFEQQGVSAQSYEELENEFYDAAESAFALASKAGEVLAPVADNMLDMGINIAKQVFPQVGNILGSIVGAFDSNVGDNTNQSGNVDNGTEEAKLETLEIKGDPVPVASESSADGDDGSKVSDDGDNDVTPKSNATYTDEELAAKSEEMKGYLSSGTAEDKQKFMDEIENMSPNQVAQLFGTFEDGDMLQDRKSTRLELQSR